VHVKAKSVDSSTDSAPKAVESLERALVAAQVAADNRGRDIVVLDMREVTAMFDYFVLVTGTSRRQLHAISEEIDRTLEKDLGDRRLGIEGYRESRWILLDYGDVVMHLFDAEAREFYAIEDLWSQAKRVPFEPRVSRPASL
jgi:ribosome-associated protein